MTMPKLPRIRGKDLILAMRHAGFDVIRIKGGFRIEGERPVRAVRIPIEGDTEGCIRAGAHEDINLITLLLGAEESGLQILRPDGSWMDVSPPEGGLSLNVGDMLQRLTNHRLRSTTHRVVNPAPERAHLPRYSIPFFLHFAPDYLIETLASCVNANNRRSNGSAFSLVFKS